MICKKHKITKRVNIEGVMFCIKCLAEKLQSQNLMREAERRTNNLVKSFGIDVRDLEARTEEITPLTGDNKNV